MVNTNGSLKSLSSTKLCQIGGKDKDSIRYSKDGIPIYLIFKFSILLINLG